MTPSTRPQGCKVSVSVLVKSALETIAKPASDAATRVKSPSCGGISKWPSLSRFITVAVLVLIANRRAVQLKVIPLCGQQNFHAGSRLAVRRFDQADDVRRLFQFHVPGHLALVRLDGAGFYRRITGRRDLKDKIKRRRTDDDGTFEMDFVMARRPGAGPLPLKPRAVAFRPARRDFECGNRFAGVRVGHQALHRQRRAERELPFRWWSRSELLSTPIPCNRLS